MSFLRLYALFSLSITSLCADDVDTTNKTPPPNTSNSTLYRSQLEMFDDQDSYLDEEGEFYKDDRYGFPPSDKDSSSTKEEEPKPKTPKESLG